MKLLFCSLLSWLAAAAEENPVMPVGGQAVIEGVVMKGYKRWGLAVRLDNGSIEREHWPLRPLQWGGVEKWPVVRGFAVMVEMMREGFRALSRSASLSLGEEDTMTTRDMVVTALVAFVMVFGLFVALPLWSASAFQKATAAPLWLQHIVEGLTRGVIFLLYLSIVGLWKDMKRVLAYHGAEHKTINAYEQGGDMTALSIMGYSRIHPRCGTSFLMIVIVVSILVFSLIGGGALWWRLGMRVLLLPVVVGLSYEVIRKASRSALGCRLMKPALSLQYLTTREPDVKQVETGLAALEEALGRRFDDEESSRKGKEQQQ